ncbi:tRNA modification GTPase MnmE [endosymbiont of Euscepes postfasciatus]|uniref:tRNA uridine-5-carboxymethylaminomethyl(34) synthesis GTPase MnmE n=1 Tax=endosymbiont of Euscepes postfasciatus TaxID=650377 RepID=UPI000DC6F11F|nr:tRNA uridine-5-carboxymethylaminomethyl(34) synthesis GTPase MnmE [endosymbiont of Euscepes postfasciatus]BBA84748.1 tRNA modification GTPase MnmE [endosymbiont of Euscepes postfasciatus]
MNKYFLNINDTIIAISTPIGKGGIGIIRISGSKSELISKIFFNKKLKPRYATFSIFINPYNNEKLDNGILILFKKPNSFTGEDVLEFQTHGNPIMLNYIIDIIIKKIKIRLSYPGEFSFRSYINNKINLDQSEAILNLINSESILSAKMSIKSLYNIFLEKLNIFLEKIDELHILLETYINFSEYDIDENYILKKINYIRNSLIQDINKNIENFNISKSIFNGIKISIIGDTNVGKSTLFNALINENKSIISNISGTTRDVVDYNLWINGILFNIYDTAGIRETNDKLELLGIEKTIEKIINSDHILYVIDKELNTKNINIDNIINNLLKNNNININNIKNIPYTIIKNKSDIYNEKICIKNINNINIIYISAKKKYGIKMLNKYLKFLIKKNIKNINFFINSRQIELLKKIINILNLSYLSNFVIFSKYIKDIKNLILDYINNNNKNENILEKIFSKFCIGK